MQLGIFAKTYARPDVAGCLRAVADAGIPATQLNLSVVGLPTVPTEPVPQAVLDEIRRAAEQTGVELAALSGTFNAADPDPARRRAGLEAFPLLVSAAAALGIGVVTLSSGSRDAQDMWRWHADNATEQAWDDSRSSLRRLVGIAAGSGVSLAFEPEHSNVVATADQAVRMLAEVGSPLLGVVYDAANLLDPDDWDLAEATASISRDVATLAPHILLAHAKELTAGRAQVGPGAGWLPWGHVVDTLRANGFDGTLVTHGLAEGDVAPAVATLEAALTATPPA